MTEDAMTGDGAVACPVQAPVLEPVTQPSSLTAKVENCAVRMHDDFRIRALSAGSPSNWDSRWIGLVPPACCAFLPLHQ
jgi:hypothetical protein